jgi:DNA processing protein
VDRIDLQLALGRAGLSAGLLRTARQRLSGGGIPDPEALASVVGQSRERLVSLGLSGHASAALAAPDRGCIERDRRWLERTKAQLLDAFSAEYPSQLASVAAAPALLYVLGTASLLATPQLAIVGTRRPSEEGRRNAYALALQLAQRGLTITSGLALGIDAAAHSGALEGGGYTIAVLGCGLEQIYPREHEALGARIAREGALISEFPPDSAPRKAHFPRRNRLISALALGTLVVEATRLSGSLITARYAAQQGRRVMAVPGSIHNPLARGCHTLIREGATLVEGSADILESLDFYVPRQLVMKLSVEPEQSSDGADPLDKDHKILLDALGFGPASIDTLIGRTGFPSHSVASMLLILELEGAVQLQPGGRYMRIQSR